MNARVRRSAEDLAQVIAVDGVWFVTNAFSLGSPELTSPLLFRTNHSQAVVDGNLLASNIARCLWREKHLSPASTVRRYERSDFIVRHEFLGASLV